MSRRKLLWLTGIAGGIVALGHWPGALISVLEVITPNILWRVDTNRPVLALTFDDGPDSTYTPKVLEILAANNVHATFFLVGGRARRFPALVEAIRAAGHEVANHTDSPDRTIGLTTTEFEVSLLEAERTLELAGREPRFFRPAGGFIRPSQADIARAHGYTVTLGSGYAFDPYRPPAGYIVWQMKRSLAPGAIWVLHDAGGNRGKTLAAVEELVPWSIEQGFEFVTLSDLVRPAEN